MARRTTTPQSRRSKRTRKTAPTRLRVSFADADRVRRHLLSEHVQVLNTKDIRIMLNILNDVYPTREMRSRRYSPRSSQPKSSWQPFLLGIGIGLILLVGALTVV